MLRLICLTAFCALMACAPTATLPPDFDPTFAY